MNAADYWNERDKQNATKIYEYSDRQGQMVTRWFSRAAKEMDETIRNFTRKYATDNGLTYQQSKMELSDQAALRELTEHYEMLLAVAPSDPIVNDWLTRFHTMRSINREQFLKAQLDMIASKSFAKYADATAHTLTTMFEESYYKSLFDQQQYVGYGTSFNRLSTNFIAAATSTKWSGKNYSQILWGDHRVSLARYMDRIITTGVIEGKSNQIMTAELQKAMSTSSYNARRLIRTDASYVANRGSLLGYQEFGTEEYKFLATLDFKTSIICRDMDGRTFKVSAAKPGINIPPLHPFCRSTTAPHVPDAMFDRDNTRVARDGKGNTYKVSASMSYKEWYSKHVQPYKEELLAEQKYKNGRSDSLQWQRYRGVLGRNAPVSLAQFQNLKYTDVTEYDELKKLFRLSIK